MSGLSVKTEHVPRKIATNLEKVSAQKLEVFRICADLKDKANAADALGINEANVANTINQLEVTLGTTLFAPEKGNRFANLTDDGRWVLRQTQQIVALSKGLFDRDKELDVRISLLPHHAAFVAKMIADMEAKRLATKNTPIVEPWVLGEQHRSVDEFRGEALRELRLKTRDIVIGPGPADGELRGLHRFKLYEANLVALIKPSQLPVEGGFISMRHLAAPDSTENRTATRLLLPPRATRAGKAIHRELVAILGDEDAVKDRIRLRAYGTKVLAMFASAGLGVVVVPADIAFAFAPKGPFYGEPFRIQEFDWVPVRDRNDKLMTHTVYATTLLDVYNNDTMNSEKIKETVHRLKEAAASTFEGWSHVRMLTDD